MAKQIRIDAIDMRINETEYRTLAYIAEVARAATGFACVPVSVSRRDFCQVLGVSESGSIRTCHSLEDRGLIEVAVYASAGKMSAANTYALTARGIEVLRLAEEAIANGRVGV